MKLEEHLSGRKHRQAEQRSQVAQRCVYVRGFSKKDVKKDEILELFLQFGAVREVVVPWNKVQSPLLLNAEQLCKFSCHDPSLPSPLSLSLLSLFLTISLCVVCVCVCVVCVYVCRHM